MALFKKVPEIGNAKPIYTLGLQKTILIAGLGNPGKKYVGTRHNIGFACLDELHARQDFDNWTDKKDLKSQIAIGNIGSTRVILCKPTTFMNSSGEAVQAVSHFYKVAPQGIVVIHDEIDINFGQIRTRLGGSSAGHNGIKSVSQYIGGDYGRMRVGVGPKKPARIDSADFVLATFSAKEQEQLPHLLQESTAILTEIIHSGQIQVETRSFIV